MTSSCIVSQAHVPDFDVQGSLHYVDKLNLVEFGIRHLRAFNPGTCIIVVGHGHRPASRVLDLCDYVGWDEPCYPLNEHGYVAGMPAQFKSVYRGLAEAQRRGYKRVLKTRGDCVIGIPNITAHCDEILNAEVREWVVTQQTGPERMGDCFMYGDTETMCKTWHEANPVLCESDGLQNTALNFRRAFGDAGKGNWEMIIKTYCSLRDVDNLKFTCLRWNYRELHRKFDEMLNRGFPFTNYHWGKANGWHHFDRDRNMTGTAHWMWSEKGFYTDDD